MPWRLRSVGSTRYMTGTSGMGWRGLAMCLQNALLDEPQRESVTDLHVHGDAHGPQIADAHDTADDISTEVVKDEDFPDGVPVSVEDGGNRREEPVGLDLIRVGRLDGLVEIEDLFQRGLRIGSLASSGATRRKGSWRLPTDLSISQRDSLGSHGAMARWSPPFQDAPAAGGFGFRDPAQGFDRGDAATRRQTRREGSAWSCRGGEDEATISSCPGRPTTTLPRRSHV